MTQRLHFPEAAETPDSDRSLSATTHVYRNEGLMTPADPMHEIAGRTEVWVDCPEPKYYRHKERYDFAEYSPSSRAVTSIHGPRTVGSTETCDDFIIDQLRGWHNVLTTHIRVEHDPVMEKMKMCFRLGINPGTDKLSIEMLVRKYRDDWLDYVG